jgi:hypothetical protein
MFGAISLLRPFGPTPLWAADFTSLTPGSVSLAGYGLSFSRASTATVQINATTVTTGIAVDAARAGRLSASDFVGYVHERQSINRVADSVNLSSANWTAFFGSVTRTAGYAVSPDGTSNGTRCEAPSGVALAETAASGSFTRMSGFVWLRAPTGTSQGGSHVYYVAPATRSFDTATRSTTWEKWTSSTSHVANTSSYHSVADGRDFSGSGGLAAGARDIVVWGAQREELAYSTEYIPTSGSAVTRSMDRLYRSVGNDLINLGRLSLEINCRPKASTAGYHLMDPYLWYYDANNNARVVYSTGAVVVRIGGVDYTTPVAMSWAANDALDIYIAAGGSIATDVRYRVNGGSRTVLTTGTPTSFGSLNFTGALEIMCSSADSAKSLTAWITRLAAYNLGERPTWAN